MKSVLLRVLILMVTVIFVFGVGCEGPIGPAGPAGPEGVEGPTGADGVLTPETLSAIDQCLVSYFDALNSYAAFQETEPPVEFDVFDGMFAFPVFVEEYEYNHSYDDRSYWWTNLTGSYSFETHENLGFFYNDALFDSRESLPSTQLVFDLVAIWSIEGGFTSEPEPVGPQPTSLSSTHWIWVRALVQVSGVDYYGGPVDHYATKDFALSVGVEGTIAIRSVHLWSPYWEIPAM